MNLHWYLCSISISRLFLAFPLSLYVTSFSVNKKTFFHYFQYHLCAPSLILWVISLLCWSHPWLPHSFAATFVVTTTPRRSGGKGWGGKGKEKTNLFRMEGRNILFFFFKFSLFLKELFIFALLVCCCVGCSLVAVHGLLIAVASLTAEHRL